MSIQQFWQLNGAGGAGYDTDAQAVITAIQLSDSLTTTQKGAINTRILRMKSRGSWTRRIAYYGFVGGSAGAHKWNWKDPRDLDAAYRLAFSGTWTQSANGILPDGTTAYADTFIVPSSVLSLNSMHGAIYSRTNGTVNGYDFGSGTPATSDKFYLWTKGTDNITYSALNTNDITVGNVISDTRGYIMICRTASNAVSTYRNGSSIHTGSTVSVARTSVKIAISAFNNGAITDRSNRQLSSVSFGDAFNSTEAADENTDEQEFQTLLSRNV